MATMAGDATFLTAAEMERLSPQERADAIEAAITRSWDEVPEPFKSHVLAAASELGEQRRRHG